MARRPSPPSRGVGSRSPRATLEEAIRAYNAGDAARAIQGATALLQRNRNDVKALGLLSMAQMHRAQFQEALVAAERALKIQPGDAMLHTLRARSLRMLGRTDEAIEAFDAALAADPQIMTAAAGKAILLLALNRIDEAEAAIAPFRDQLADAHQIALAAARVDRARGRYEQGIEGLRSVLDSAMLPTGARVDVLFLLASLLDRAKRHDEAFEVVQEANQARVASFDATSHRAAVERSIKALTPDRYAALPAAETEGTGRALPIFILGLPRSGTTLVEQILGAHPDVLDGGEQDTVRRLVVGLQQPAGVGVPGLLQHPQLLTSAGVQQLRARYLASMPRPKDGTRVRFVTDKMPANVTNLPLIRRMFPDAPIIHCVRDIRDTALSCYFQQFGSAMSWLYRPEWIVAYFEDVTRLADHARETLGVDCLTVDYQRMVTEPERGARRLIEHAGLPWDDACLRPHEVKRDARTSSVDQVTKPIYTSSVERWRAYESHLSAMFEALPVQPFEEDAD